MKTQKSRRLVIDASVVQSAGESEHPVSSACRAYLEAILNICHHAVLTKYICDEWNKHMSNYSRKWRRSMLAHRKSLDDIIPKKINFNTKGLSVADLNAIEKDLFLIEAALSADSIIITRDEDLLRRLAKTSQGLELLNSITWINPVTDGIIKLERL